MAQKGKDYLRYYNQFKDKIFNYFWYRLEFNTALAEDMTSEVFLKAFENFDSYDEERPFQAWIYAIARNHLLNYYRVAGREVEIDYARGFFIDEIMRIDTNLELEKVMDEIKSLEPYHRDVLLMRFVDGLENKEIAQLLDKEEGAVRTQISRALQTLRKKICSSN